ncbi:hypothetical protein SDC9_174021 [bioreactor metagenome]|uniref:Uncharacterized protein n=1 Tax=bioreactor metagenome TaxID=1076179 RepID=A0A645GK47_9ZZZZ
MMRSLREEVRRYNIKVINIIPGATATPIWDAKVLAKKQHLMATSNDIANLVVSTLHLCGSSTAMLEDITIQPQNGNL